MSDSSRSRPAWARGPRIDFWPLELSDAPMLVRWFNDPDVTQYLARVMPMTLEAEQEWLKKKAGDQDDLIFLIAVRDEGRAIGTVGLHGPFGLSRKGLFGLSIGEKEYWNRGYGSEATELMLEVGFDRLNLNRIELEVYETNPRAIRVYERAGYVTEGVARQARFIRGRYVDVRRMAVLADEWRAKRSFAAGAVCQT